VSRLPIALLSPDPDAPFPPPQLALREPDGLLAAGGDLSPTRLLNAYRQGIFPWFGPGQPILWWSPDPRMVFYTDSFCLPTRFRRVLRKSPWVVRADTAFDKVISACASASRPGQDATWITADMITAYVELHRLGHAHSIEVYEGEALIGGIYGVAVGQMFFGESMFSAASGASKLALAGLVRLLRRWSWPLIDAQVENPHLRSLGACELSRDQFLDKMEYLAAMPGRPGPWTGLAGDWPARTFAKSLD
jgi:leucyl/phenylalanyl-tRNA--protein transferase